MGLLSFASSGEISSRRSLHRSVKAQNGTEPAVEPASSSALQPLFETKMPSARIWLSSANAAASLPMGVLVKCTGSIISVLPLFFRGFAGRPVRDFHVHSPVL